MTDEQDNRERPLGDLATRLMRAGAGAVSVGAEKLREKGEDLKAREIVSGAASLTARGKEELMTLVAKEVRGYMEKLRVGEELTKFLTEHSLEVQASISLKSLVPAAKGSAEDPTEDPAEEASEEPSEASSED